MNFERIWMKIGVSGVRLNTPGEDRHWRLFAGSSLEEIPIKGYVALNVGTALNHQSKSCVPRDAERQLAAWICLFGNLRVEDDVAYIELLEPTPDEVCAGDALDPPGTFSLRKIRGVKP